MLKDIRKSASEVLPDRIKNLRFIIAKITFFGKARYCPICSSQVRKFYSYGLIPRPNARCPVCGSLERHRLFWLYAQEYTNLFDQSPKRMLHVAPETCLKRKFERIANLDYLTADLFDPRAMIKMDIMDIQYPDNSFDIIYCSHVLEHVPDDRQAMREFHRILKPDGWAMLLVPIISETTFEDPSITSPEERKRVFGQHDHVRRYGPDYGDRLKEAGFNVLIVSAEEITSSSNLPRLGLKNDQIIFFCRK